MKYQPPFVYGATPGAPGIHNADPDAGYINGDPSIGQEGSYIPCEAVEHTQREIIAAVAAAGLTPDHTVLTQLRQSIARSASGATWFACTGAANAYTLAATGAFDMPTSPFSGQLVRLRPNHTNTGAATATFAGVTKAIRTWNDAALPAGSLVSGRPTEAIYDPTANGGAGALLILPWADAASALGVASPTEAGGGTWDMWRASLAGNVTGITNNTAYRPTLTQDGAASFGSYSAGVFTISRAGFYLVIGGTDGAIFCNGASTYFNATWIERNDVIQSRNTANGYNTSAANPTTVQTSCVVASAAFYPAGATLEMMVTLNAAVAASGHTLYAGRQTSLSIIPLVF